MYTTGWSITSKKRKKKKRRRKENDIKESVYIEIEMKGKEKKRRGRTGISNQFGVGRGGFKFNINMPSLLDKLLISKLITKLNWGFYFLGDH